MNTKLKKKYGIMLRNMIMVPYICAADFNCFVMNGIIFMKKLPWTFYQTFMIVFASVHAFGFFRVKTIKDKSMVAAAYSVYFSLKNLG